METSDAAYKLQHAAGWELTEVGDEGILYFQGDARVHLLSPALKRMYQGSEEFGLLQLAQYCYPGHPLEEAVTLTQAGLAELMRAGALEEIEAGLARRTFLRRAVQGAAPLLVSTLLPSPAAAYSCRCRIATSNSVTPSPPTSTPGVGLVICVPPWATRILLTLDAGLDAAFSFRLTPFSLNLGRCITTSATWGTRRCGSLSTLPTCTLVSAATPYQEDIMPLFIASGGRTGGCDTLSLSCNYCEENPRPAFSPRLTVTAL